MRKFWAGLIAGASAGYVAARALQAAALIRRAPKVRASDPAAYGRERRALAIAGMLRSTLSTFAFAYGPLAARIERALDPLPRWSQPGAYFAGLTLVSSIIDLPVSFVEEYAVERRFGLSEQPASAFLVDWSKGTAISVVVTGGLAILGGVAVRVSIQACAYRSRGFAAGFHLEAAQGNRSGNV